MSSLTLEQPAWRQHGVALGIAVALHVGVLYLLLNLSHTPELPPVPATVIQTQLVSLPAPAPAAPATPVAPPPPVAEPVVEPAPVVQAPPVDAAALARKRVQQVQRERQQQLEQARRQRQEAEHQAQLAREEHARQARLHEQQLAQARQAESARQAAAQARADAEAASRHYQPIAKQAPDYPQRALDRHIEGECTVAYTVDPQGRVNDPQVVGNCHPLFVKPSLAAAKRFRYQPRVVNGQAVAVANVKNTFSFRIE